jgi:hypothetical protein
LLLIPAPLSVVISAVPALSYCYFTGFAWSIAVFFFLINARLPEETTEQERFRRNDREVRAFLLLVVLFAVAVLFGMRAEYKIPIAGTVAKMIPNLLGPLFGSPSGMDPNDAGGILSLFVPVAFALALETMGTQKSNSQHAKGSQPFRFLALGVLLIALFLTQSRDAWLSAGIGIGVVLMMLGRRGLLPAGILIAGLLILVFAAGSDRVIDALLFAGKHTGLTIDSVLTFRSGIWEAAVILLRDVYPIGLGFGVFGSAAPVLYPFTSPGVSVIIADAHNVYLQTMLDFGIGGFGIFLGLLVLATRGSLRAARNRGMFEYQHIGLFAGLVGFLVFNLFDAVALGSPMGAGWWIYFGLTFRNGSPPPPWLERGKRRCWLSLGAAVTMVGACGLVFLPSFQDTIRMQHATICTAKALLSDSSSLPHARTVAIRATTENSRAGWLLGLLCERQGDIRARDSAWCQLLLAHESYIPVLQRHAPTSRLLAEHAYQSHPEASSACFWLADIVSTSDTVRSVELYRSGLRKDTENGLAWCRLGLLLIRSDPAAAVTAFGESCRHGDPGANGCYLAGRVSELSGKYSEAIRWYRLSRWSVAKACADRLELQIAAHDPGTAPLRRH